MKPALNNLAIEKIKVILLGIFICGTCTLFAKAPQFNKKELSKPPSNVIRTCCAFGADLSIARIPFLKKTDIASFKDIGPHHYLGSHDEGNGIIYTKRGGFIDLGHLRDYADWTAFLYKRIQLSAQNREDIFLKLGSEGGSKILIIKNIWEANNKEHYELAGHIAYNLSVWHEIATWFGSSYIPMIPERYSSFSPEDLYSNLLGVKIGIQALKSNLEYNEAMTQLLANTLDSLDAVTSADETYAAMEQVENIWWNPKKPLPSSKILLLRYLDPYSFLQPWLLPGDNINHTSYTLHKPDLLLSELYELRINPNRNFPSTNSSSKKQKNTINQNDFRCYIDYIERKQLDKSIKSSNRLEKMSYRKSQKKTKTNNI